ncbi:MAG TPA: metallophosphoesterase family protein [Anaerolineaceae bacterium]|nr:metallophosphoesterase family protein [Anaerolineaceae bacterium]
MPVMVISDIHANLTALDAVLEDAGPVDAVWCLGDLVGYGPDPNECIARVRGLRNLICLVGNHDAAALGEIDVETFNTEAKLSVKWMQTELTAESMAFLRDLPERIVVGQVTLTHGSPRNPVWEYILDTRVARYNFSHFDTDFCFVGHTHLPVVYTDAHSPASVHLAIPKSETRIQLTPRAIINPGSVGQPRDRDPRASYAIFDPETNTWSYRRVNYDVAQVQKRILAAGLPARHAIRLAEGW